MNSRALALGLLLGLAACASALLDEPAASAEEVSASVPPQESEPGNFGVDCSTSCLFVKKGVSDFESHGRAALLAAEDLAESQKALAHVLERLEIDPENEELQLEKAKLEIEVDDKTRALQIAAGADVPDSALEVERAAVDAAKAQMAHIEEQLADSPDDPKLQRERDELEQAILSKEKAMESAAMAEQEATMLQDEVRQLGKRLSELQDAADKEPQSEALKQEMESVQAALAAKTTQQQAMTPKKECYRVCVNPNTHSKPAGRRLLATVAARDVNNCIRMCVRVMHHLANRLAKEESAPEAAPAVADA